VLTPHCGWPADSGFEGFAENAVANIFDNRTASSPRPQPEDLQHRAKPRFFIPCKNSALRFLRLLTD
jgi:hypothetical protein